MKRMLTLVVSLFALALFAAGAPKKKAAATAGAAFDGLRVTGTLTKADGTPMAGRRVFAFPVDSQGTALVVNTLGDGGRVELWNPVATSDKQGRFRLEIPLLAKIGDEEISEVSLSVDEPPGGIVTVTVVKMTWADPKKKESFGMMRKESSLAFLRSGATPLRVKLAKGSKDVGSVIAE